MKTPLYTCSRCALGVLVLSNADGSLRVVRGCECDAPVTANAVGNASGRSKAAG